MCKSSPKPQNALRGKTPTLGVRVGEFVVSGLKTLKGLKDSHICYYRDVITSVDVTSRHKRRPSHWRQSPGASFFFKDGRFTPTGRYAPTCPSYSNENLLSLIEARMYKSRRLGIMA